MQSPFTTTRYSRLTTGKGNWNQSRSKEERNLNHRVGVIKKRLGLTRDTCLTNSDKVPLAACFRGAISKCPEILNYWNWIAKGMKEHFLFMLSFWQVAVPYFVFNLIVLFTIYFFFLFFYCFLLQFYFVLSFFVLIYCLCVENLLQFIILLTRLFSALYWSLIIMLI